MALIKCGNCGSEVSNTGKCPKCGALICKECGHVLGKKEIKCPNCGKSTAYLSKKVLSGCILLFLGIFCIPSMGGENEIAYPDYGGQIEKLNIMSLLGSILCIVMGLYFLIKYGIKKYF